MSRPSAASLTSSSEALLCSQWAVTAPSAVISAALRSCTVQVKLTSNVHAAAPTAPASTECWSVEQLHLPAALVHLFQVTLSSEHRPMASFPPHPLGALAATARLACTRIKLDMLPPPACEPPSVMGQLERALATPCDSGAFL